MIKLIWGTHWDAYKILRGTQAVGKSSAVLMTCPSEKVHALNEAQARHRHRHRHPPPATATRHRTPGVPHRTPQNRSGAFAFISRSRTAAGVTWSTRIASAPWGGRGSHTSVIDAAGTIYVIGGHGVNGINYKDVWVLTDGGADETRGGRHWY